MINRISRPEGNPVAESNPETSPVVLVVDDESSMLRLCQRALEGAAFQVITAKNSGQALEILARQPVSLLLADIRMPGLDGLQLLDLARRQNPGLATVVMTGFGTIETAISALQHGADGLILKPFETSALIQTARHSIEQSERKQDVVRLRALQPLFSIIESLFTQTDLEELDELIIDITMAQLNCSYAGLFQRNPSVEFLRPVVSKGQPFLLAPMQLEQAVWERCVILNIPLRVCRDGPGDPVLQDLLVNAGLSSLMCVQIMHHDSSGVLVAARQTNEPYFREPDLEMLNILARQGSIALENAYLYGELRSYIVQLEKSQRALVQAEKMAAAGRLTVSLAHAINNPLQSLHNCLHLARRKELSAGERQKNLDMVESELDRLITTVQHMLDFYRPYGRDRKLTDVNELIRQIILLLEKQLNSNGISVQLNLSPDLPPIIVVTGQIQQVFINLIINAMEAMPDGGEIILHTFPYKAAGKGSISGGVEVLIEDTGPGIPVNKWETIFEPFVTTKADGTGLGLSISYGIILAHGGTLGLTDGRGKGACFRITLPVGDVQ